MVIYTGKNIIPYIRGYCINELVKNCGIERFVILNRINNVKLCKTFFSFKDNLLKIIIRIIARKLIICIPRPVSIWPLNIISSPDIMPMIGIEISFFMLNLPINASLYKNLKNYFL